MLVAIGGLHADTERTRHAPSAFVQNKTADRQYIAAGTTGITVNDLLTTLVASSEHSNVQGQINGGGDYRVTSNPGQAYRYVWEIPRSASGNETVELRIRNALTNVSMEVRLVSAAEAR